MKPHLLPRELKGWLWLTFTMMLFSPYFGHADGLPDKPTARIGHKPTGGPSKRVMISSSKLYGNPSKPAPGSNDPIRFTIQANKRQVAVGEPIELTITARYMAIHPSLLFSFEGSNAFRLKVLVPEDFVITGGTYHDYVGDQLTASHPVVTYTVQGYFTKIPDKPQFRLLRGSGQADEQSLFADKGQLPVKVLPAKESAARVASTTDVFSWCAEAESGSGSAGVASNGQASGGQHVGNFGNSAEYRTFTVSGVPSAGSYTLHLWYTSWENPVFGIVVNGTLQTASASANNSWTGPFAEKQVSINLTSGSNTVRIQGSGAGSFLLDRLCVDGGTSTPACAFTPTASVSNANPGCGSTVTLSAACTGADCSGVSYAWSGNGLNQTGQSVSATVPNANGSYMYTVTASKTGCANKTATTTVNLSSCTTPTSFSWCAEAESGSGSAGVASNGQASGGQHVGNFGNSAEYRSFTVGGVPSAGSYTLHLWYTSWENPVFGIVVNGTLQTASASANNSWTGPFAEKQVSINLTSGSNTVRIQGSGAGSFLLDRLCVDGGTTACTFTPTASVSNANPGCGSTVTLSVACTGADCNGVSYVWSGNGLNQSGQSVSATVPNTNGSYTYTVTASRSGCANKTATTTVTVGGCQPTTSLSAGCYTVKSQKTSQLLQAMSDGSIKQQGANGQTNQIWKAEDAGNSQFRFTTQNGTNQVMRVNNGTSNGEQLSLGAYTGDDKQKWSVQKDDATGSYRVYRSNGITWDLNNYGNSPELQLYGTTSEPFFNYREFRFETATCPTTPACSYSRVLLVGNSITHHPGVPGAWPNNWGMAASAANKDYKHILTGYLQTLNPNVEVREFADFSAQGMFITDGPYWEQNYWQLSGGLDRFNPAAAGHQI